MIPLIKRIALFGMAIAVGAAAFTFVWTSHASAAIACPTPYICYQGKTYQNAAFGLCEAMLLNGGQPVACSQISPN